MKTETLSENALFSFWKQSLTMTKMFIVLVKNIISFFSKESKCGRVYPSPVKSVNSELVEFDLFHLNRLLWKEETI